MSGDAALPAKADIDRSRSDAPAKGHGADIARYSINLSARPGR